MQGNGLAGSSTRLSLAPPTAWCYEQTNDATDQPSGGIAPPDGVIQWAERLWLVPEQVAGEYCTWKWFPQHQDHQITVPPGERRGWPGTRHFARWKQISH